LYIADCYQAGKMDFPQFGNKQRENPINIPSDELVGIAALLKSGESFASLKNTTDIIYQTTELCDRGKP